MKLTLRRLLAYLDGILSEDDAGALGERLKESDFASRLVPRIRHVTSRPQLAAPRIHAQGMGLDANTVAEYLDHTLDDQRVPDFEKICLESDVHLAEVASSHSILALVLAEPATVEPTIRERVYRLPDEGRPAGRTPEPVADVGAGRRLDDAHAGPAQDVGARGAATGRAAGGRRDGAPAAGAATPTANSAPNSVDRATKSSQQEMQEERAVSAYLGERGRRSPIWTAAGVLTASFLVVVVFLRAIGPFDQHHPVLGRLVAQGNRPSSAGEKSRVELPRLDQTSDGAAEPGAGSTEPSTSPPLEIDGGASTEPATLTEPPAPPAVEPAPAPLPPMEVEGVAPPPAPIEPEPAAPGPAAPNAGDAIPMPPTSTDDTNMPSPPAPAIEPSAMLAEVGRTGSDDEVLARRGADGEWFRLAPRTVVRAEEVLFVPPAYRPELTLASGIQVVIIGPARLQLLANDEQGVPGVRLIHGRMLAGTAAVAGARLRIELPTASGEFLPGQVVFETADSELAVEIERRLAVGEDPVTGPAVEAANLWSTAGTIVWQGGVTMRLEMSASLAMLDGVPQSPIDATSPLWVSDANLKGADSIDRRFGAADLKPLLTTDRPLVLSLGEPEVLEEKRKLEMRSLAVRTLAWLGIYEPLVRSLGDEALYSYWASHIETLHAIQAASPQAAQGLRAALANVRDGDAPTLTRLIQGYNNSQLTDGGDAALVDLLQHPALDVRVLAADNLRRITAGKTHLFRPEKSSDSQRQPLLRWKGSLESGEIRWKIPG